MIYEFETPVKRDEGSALMWDYRLIVPSDIVAELSKPDRRVICTINDTIKIHCALMPDGTGSHFIMLNKEIRKKLSVETGDSLNIKLEKDNTEYGMAIPEAFTELCEQDPEGKAVFHTLTKGKQRSLLHIMNKPKSEQKKLEKTLIIFDYLKSVNGKLDFKELNEAFKNSRFKL